LSNVGQLLDFLRARGALWQDVLADKKTVRVASIKTWRARIRR